MHIQLTTRLQAMKTILCDISDGFDDDGLVWYDCMYEPVSNINGYVFIDTVVLIWVSAGVLSLGVNVSATAR